MTAGKPPKRFIPVHPLLFAVFPIISLLATNISEVELEAASAPVAAALAATAVFFFAAGLALRQAEKGALVTTLWLLLFFSYGHLYSPLNAAGLAAGHQKYLAAWIFLGTLASIALIRAKRDLGAITKFLNIVGLVMLIMPLVNIAQYERSRESSLAARSGLTPLKQVKATPAQKDRRDIYYLIFDRYSSAPALKEALDFDNRQFMDRLRSRGFFVAEKSRANYPITYLSLSSSLNLAYHEEARDQKALEESLQDHRAQRFLKGRGYKYFHYGSDWPPTNFNRFANMSISFDKSDFDPFARLLLRTTMAGPFVDRFRRPEKENGERLLSQLRALSKVPLMEGPKFVFSHILLPHEPYSFDARGRPRSADEQREVPEIELYKDYIRFANKKIGSLVDDIIIRSKRPPIIIIQADEGFRYDTSRYTKAGYMELHYAILNAYYLPGVDAKKVVYDSITPVNSLRAVFNAYFDAGFELLDDENYRLVTEGETIKGFERVTDKLRKE